MDKAPDIAIISTAVERRPWKFPQYTVRFQTQRKRGWLIRWFMHQFNIAPDISTHEYEGMGEKWYRLPDRTEAIPAMSQVCIALVRKASADGSIVHITQSLTKGSPRRRSS